MKHTGWSKNKLRAAQAGVNAQILKGLAGLLPYPKRKPKQKRRAGSKTRNTQPLATHIPAGCCAMGLCGPEAAQAARTSKHQSAFTLIESLVTIALVSILASMLASAIGNVARRLAWKANYIATFHNARIASAVEERFGQIDMQIEDGSYQAVLAWK